MAEAEIERQRWKKGCLASEEMCNISAIISQVGGEIEVLQMANMASITLLHS